MIPVAIVLVHRLGCYLVRLRPELPGSPMPGVWEFPGGKCDEGESPEEATARSAEEGDGPGASRSSALRRVIRHEYPHGAVELHYFDAETADGRAEPAEGSGFRWVGAAELPGLVFPPANGPIVEELAGGVPPGPAGR